MTRSMAIARLAKRAGVGVATPEPRTQRERATAALSVRERIRALRQAREALPLASPVRYWSATQIAYVEDVLAGEERRLEVLQREADAPELAFEWTNPNEPVFRIRGGLWRTRSHNIGWAIWLAARSGRARLYGVTPRVAHRRIARAIDSLARLDPELAGFLRFARKRNAPGLHLRRIDEARVELTFVPPYCGIRWTA